MDNPEKLSTLSTRIWCKFDWFQYHGFRSSCRMLISWLTIIILALTS